MPTLTELAKAIAISAHEGQTRRGGAPYITHCAAVAAAFPDADDEELRAVAYLHDVLEDCPHISARDLLDKGIPSHVVEAVQILTKKPGEDYLTYLARVKTDTLARRVKVEDIRHNLSDDPSRKASTRYHAGLKFLAE